MDKMGPSSSKVLIMNANQSGAVKSGVVGEMRESKEF